MRGRRLQKAKFDPYLFLTHAIWHCQYGSKPTERPPDPGDLGAVQILDTARKSLQLVKK